MSNQPALIGCCLTYPCWPLGRVTFSFVRELIGQDWPVSGTVTGHALVLHLQMATELFKNMVPDYN